MTGDPAPASRVRADTPRLPPEECLIAIYRPCSLVALVAAIACASSNGVVPSDGPLAIGTWGGDSGGLIVTDTAAHLHVGCTFGDLKGRIVLDAEGRFTASGTYMLRAYPITIGPTVPAQFAGQLRGKTLVVTATVNDTAQKTTVVRGPVTLQLGVEPRMANCPICRNPYGQLVVER